MTVSVQFDKVYFVLCEQSNIRNGYWKNEIWSGFGRFITVRKSISQGILRS